MSAFLKMFVMKNGEKVIRDSGYAPGIPMQRGGDTITEGGGWQVFYPFQGDAADCDALQFFPDCDKIDKIRWYRARAREPFVPGIGDDDAGCGEFD